ncbi:hypothetical protein GCM10028832_13730 [Streptomyces sparsus]
MLVSETPFWAESPALRLRLSDGASSRVLTTVPARFRPPSGMFWYQESWNHPDTLRLECEPPYRHTLG